MKSVFLKRGGFFVWKYGQVPVRFASAAAEILFFVLTSFFRITIVDKEYYA